jgi:hypothetical protein
VDPVRRSLLELGYDQPLRGQGPQAAYAYYYYNNPELLRTNVALRLAVAPAYLDSEIGFKGVLAPYTDLGVGVFGGAFSDNYYEVRQGHYYKNESFDGYGGGVSLSLYQLLDPGMLIPLSLVARAGVRYSAFDATGDTDPAFTLPGTRTATFLRAGLRFAGKEPVLYPDLALEVSAWFERQWRFDHDPYGFGADRRVSPGTTLYWAYAGLSYSFTNIGHKASLAVTAGGSADADRFSAWRLGGVLPLVAEFPLVLPGYFYQELTAKGFLHLYGSYVIPLERRHRLQLMLEAASARIDFLPGFAQRGDWHTGVGAGLSFTPKSARCRVVARYGYGFNAVRDGREGGHSVGLLFQYDFEARARR